MQLTDGEADTGAPVWAKDGWIYFSSNLAGNFDIWRLKPTGELVKATKQSKRAVSIHI